MSKCYSQINVDDYYTSDHELNLAMGRADSWTLINDFQSAPDSFSKQLGSDAMARLARRASSSSSSGARSKFAMVVIPVGLGFLEDHHGSGMLLTD